MPVKEIEKEKTPLSAEDEILKQADKIRQNRSENNVFARQLDKYFSGEMPVHEVINVCSTPNILKLLGSVAKKVTLSQSNLKNSVSQGKISKNHTEGHEIDKEEIYKLSIAIRNPLIVLNGNKKNSNSVTLVTELLDNKGNNVFIPISLDRKNGKINEISTMYGKRNLTMFLSKHRDDILAINTKKEADLLADTENQYLQSINDTVVRFDNSIAYTMANVKYPANKEKASELGWDIAANSAQSASITCFFDNSIAHTTDNVKYKEEVALEIEALKKTKTTDTSIDKIIREHHDIYFYYQLLDRCRIDCVYYLGYGKRNAAQLWGETVEEHITAMRKLYDILPEKPQWLTEEQIDTFERRMNHGDRIIYFDTETTGLNGDDEILSISIVDNNGNIILDSLVKPEHHDSWLDAQQIHGISPDMVNAAPTLSELMPVINRAFKDCDQFVAYNTFYDMGFLQDKLLLTSDEVDSKWRDAMVDFAEVYCEYDYKHGGFKWQKLYVAAAYYKLKWQGNAHGSLADTLMTREIYLKMHPELAPHQEKNTSEVRCAERNTKNRTL